MYALYVDVLLIAESHAHDQCHDTSVRSGVPLMHERVKSFTVYVRAPRTREYPFKWLSIGEG